MTRPTIREIVLAIAVVALAAGWIIDRSQLEADSQERLECAKYEWAASASKELEQIHEKINAIATQFNERQKTEVEKDE